jgi:hypothetical protein
MLGEVAPADASRLADRLANLAMPANWQATTRKFIAACRVATSRNRPLRFSHNKEAMMRRLLNDFMRDRAGVLRLVGLPVR